MVLVVQRRQDSVQWHMTTHTCILFEHFKQKFFYFSLYNPKLAPSIIYFSHLKKFLAIQSLRSNRETKDIVQDWLTRLMVAIFSKGIQRGSHNAIMYMATMWRSSLMQVPTYGNKDNFLKFCKRSLDQIGFYFLDVVCTNLMTAQRDSRKHNKLDSQCSGRDTNWTSPSCSSEVLL